LSIYPTPVKNFYTDSQIDASDGITTVINRPIVLKSFSICVSIDGGAATTSTDSYTLKAFDGSSELIRIYDGAHSGDFSTLGSVVSSFYFKFPSNGIRLETSLAFSIVDQSGSIDFVIKNISVMYQG